MLQLQENNQLKLASYFSNEFISTTYLYQGNYKR
jgi:hypothetical protein